MKYSRPTLSPPINLSDYSFYRAEHVGGVGSDEQYIIEKLLALKISRSAMFDMRHRIMRAYSNTYKKISTSPTPGLLLDAIPTRPEATQVEAVGFARRECNTRLRQCIDILNGSGTLPYAPK